MGLKKLGAQAEPIAYWLAALAHLWPVWASTWFVTLDGPSHLNNARIMSDLLMGRGAMDEFFALNPYPEPNILGHVIMALVMSMAPAWIAEKLVFTLIITGLAFAFRSLMRTLDPEGPWSALLVMPFLLGFPLMMGFINFSLSLPLLLLVLSGWERSLKTGAGSRPWKLLVLLLLLYLAHLSSFLLAVGLMGARTAWTWIISTQDMRAFIRPAITRLASVTALPLGLSVGYFVLHHGHAAAPARQDASTLLNWVIEGRAWVTFASEPEVPWTRVIALVMLLLTGIGIIMHIRRRTFWEQPATFWLMAAMGMFACYLVLPDTMAGGSFASARLLLFTMLLLCGWIAMSPFPRGLIGPAVSLVVLADLGHLNAQAEIERGLQKEAEDLIHVAASLKEGDVVLPLNYSGNWMHSNFSSYLGAASGAVVLDNFVATAPFAPVRWRPERLPYEVIGNFDRSDRPCVRIDAYRHAGRPLVTHVLTWRMNDAMADSCTLDIRAQLAEGFNEIARSPGGHAHLYQRK